MNEKLGSKMIAVEIMCSRCEAVHKLVFEKLLNPPVFDMIQHRGRRDIIAGEVTFRWWAMCRNTGQPVIAEGPGWNVENEEDPE